MVQRLAAVVETVWVHTHTQKHAESDWKRHWPTREQILSKRQLERSLSLPPSPKNQHQRHSRSQRLHHPVKEARELDEFEVKMEVDESEMRSTPGKKIWSKWVETRKDPNSSAIRCRLCATEKNTGESRSETFASYKPKRANESMIIAVFDISVAFFHGKECAR